MESFLRDWRDNALSKHQYDSAIFVGDKLLALTNSDHDTLSLAQTHFEATNYTRALSFLQRDDNALIQRSAQARYLAAHCCIKQNRHEDALNILGDKNPLHLVTSPDATRRKLQHLQTNGASHLQPGKQKVDVSTKHRGLSRTERADRSEERDVVAKHDIKYEAGMCYLRGLCYAKSNAFDRAKECYKDAVRIDVRCFEAFDQLMKNSLMSPGEEWAFLESLNFESVLSTQDSGLQNTAEAAEFVRNIYTTRVSKYARPEDFNAAVETLSTHYKLADNPDILLAKAESLFTVSRFEPALAITSRVLDQDPYNFACLPLHIALLYQLNNSHALFALSHDLADTHPLEPCTWLAVGTYYLVTNRIPEARSYFSKSSLMDAHFGPAWIGFAHTFAAEGEGDQAIAAYSTAARLFQGTHLPQLFLGMQEVALCNLGVAREYLTAAYNLCERDPLLINEIGVVFYHEEDYNAAVRHFTLALSIAEENSAPASQYTSTRLNLAHALRKSGRFDEALEQFDEVIRLGMQDCGVFAAKGLVLLELDMPFEATVALHEGLATSPQDPMASDLLSKALALLEGQSVLGATDEEAVDLGLQKKLEEVRSRPRRSGRKGKRSVVEVEEDPGMDLDGGRDSRLSQD